MLVAIGVLFFCAAISVITNALYYLVQIPVYSGTDVRSILQLLFRLDIVGAVTARIEVSVDHLPFRLICSPATVRPQRRDCCLAGVGDVAQKFSGARHRHSLYDK